MTKQEEIKQGIYFLPRIGKLFQMGLLLEEDIDELLAYLHSQGVVIKVGGITDDLAQTASQGEQYYAWLYKGDKADGLLASTDKTASVFKALKQAGYVAVVPLIKEG